MDYKIIHMGIKVWVASWCGACKAELPKIEAAASKLGYSVQRIDISQCPTSEKAKCESISFVPHIELNGREVSVSQLEGMAK